MSASAQTFFKHGDADAAQVDTPSPARLREALGPYYPLAVCLLLGLAALTLSRLGLMIWQWERVSSQQIPLTMLAQGLRVDLIQLGMIAALLLLPAPLLATRLTWRLWQYLAVGWSMVCFSLLIFMELATPAFIAEYDSRPNLLFVEYLKYPREVLSMLGTGYKLEVLIGLAGTAAASWMIWRILKKWIGTEATWSVWRLWLTWPILFLIVAISVRSSLDHRPANPATFALTPDSMVNSLILNSTWSVAHAAYGLRNEASSSEMYGKMSSSQMLAIVDDFRMGYAGANRFVGKDDSPTLSYLSSSRHRSKPLNLVVILEESLGATFVESLGGLPVTPELEKLKHEGWWFDKMYATGTRSVRGIEAVVTGFLPTPAQAVVKLPRAQDNFFTLASLLSQHGYHTQFVYGGESHFDNMRGFFMHNGFQAVLDQNDYVDPVFRGSWGVSDEDLLDRAHAEALASHASGKPFFKLVFTSSNHSPFEFPDGRIALFGEDKATDANAVKYADWALGRYFDKARSSAYWNDTVFLVVADHDIRVRGDSLVPIERFHIPALILGADIEPRTISSVASQVDLPVTLLSLMGIAAHHPMIGRDLSLDQEGRPGRAMMQYNDHFAWMEGNAVVVLRPEKPASFGHYDFVQKQLTENVSPPPADMTERALAHSLLPSWLYREQRYPATVGD